MGHESSVQPDASTPRGRLALLAAVTAQQAAITELSAIGLAADTFDDQALNVMAVTLAGASHRLSQIAGRIAERLTPPTTTTLEDTDDKPDPHPHLAGPAGL